MNIIQLNNKIPRLFIFYLIIIYKEKTYWYNFDIMYKSGFIAILGQPNVGKSTLLNGLLKEKLAIISSKPETTRDNIRGIYTDDECQIIFVDTPGIHKPHDLLGKLMLSRAKSTIMESDAIIFITEAHKAMDPKDINILSNLPSPDEDKNVYLIINKVDRMKNKKGLLPIMKKASELYPFKEIIPISALKNEDSQRVLDIVKADLPEGDKLYPEEYLTDRDESFIVQEIIREKILKNTHEEIPHSVGVVIDEMKLNSKKNLYNIYATIYVERISQKSIIIGKNGAMLKTIGQQSRSEIEDMLSKKVYLNLWVKVFEKWKKDPKGLKELGYTD